MNQSPISRRRSIEGPAVAASGLLVAAALPAEAEAAELHYCGHPFGPIHRYLYATAPSPSWRHDIIMRESNVERDHGGDVGRAVAWVDGQIFRRSRKKSGVSKKTLRG